ncbi:MAG TPA: aldose 1-epimerase family protein [Pseudonocardiaceae bacterium]|jgi:aldose 1-epimerase|nr:aldose 1-epimerase family protein [Pseudonocardiaceae bacterium]
MSVPPSGRQYEIACGAHRATIVEVGGGIREYAVGDRPVLHPYPLDAMADGAHGAPLMPWPNRLDSGRYRFDGVSHQLALTEPATGNAIHGLLRWRSWRPAELTAEHVVMAIRLYPMQGYPFTLDVQIDYRLTGAGLAVTTTATNVGPAACPYGCGQHPYLSPGPGLIDDCTLTLPAGTRIITDAQRQLPVGQEPVAGTPFDFRTGLRLGTLSVDSAFTHLTWDTDGRARARLTGPDGATAQLWVDEAYPLIEIFTADPLAPQRRRRGLGCEPMTCPPNAFASGTGVIRLEPGQAATATWGACLD